MRTILTLALLSVAPAGLSACAGPGEPAAAASGARDHGSRRGDDWVGNARSFPYQR